MLPLAPQQFSHRNVATCKVTQPEGRGAPIERKRTAAHSLNNRGRSTAVFAVAPSTNNKVSSRPDITLQTPPSKAKYSTIQMGSRCHSTSDV